jgi:acetyl-CoA carboxylase carboxyl transferase subunit beta
LSSLFDEGIFVELRGVYAKDDPLKYRDLKKYSDRLKDARHKTGLRDATRIARGTISGKKAIVFAVDFEFMGGSMGLSFGKSFARAVTFAIEERGALIGVLASGGARMQEGMLALMQMPSTVAALCELKEAGLPFITVFTNPTTGGVAASFASLGDILVAEPGALIGFAGPRVIERTIRQKLPDCFQKSEFLMEHGMIDMIVHRRDLSTRLGLLLNYMLSDDV